MFDYRIWAILEKNLLKTDCVAMCAVLLDTRFARKVNVAIFLSARKLHLAGRRIDLCSVALVTLQISPATDIICNRTVL